MINKDFIFLKEIDSTNNYLKSLSLEKSLPEGTIVYTDFQNSGRGQRGNSWEAEAEKNILFSVILYPSFVEAAKPFILSQIVSVAIKNVLATYTAGISIKWPNDIYWNDQKICGILVENEIAGSSITKTIIGIGININQDEFRSNAPNPVSLKQITGEEHHRNEILNKVREEILSLYNISRTNAKTVIDQYKEGLYRKDGYFNFSDEKGSFSGSIENIEPSGLLILKTKSGQIRKYAFKEVTFI